MKAYSITVVALRGFLAAALLSLFVPVASAQTAAAPATTPEDESFITPASWNVTAFIGPGFGGGLQSSALSLGAALGYNWTTRLAFEGEFGYARESNSNLLNVSANTETFSGNALYYFLNRGYAPYVTFGLDLLHGGATANGIAAGTTTTTTVNGVSTTTATPLTLSSSSTDFGINLGAGVKARLNQSVRFRGDLRYFNGGSLPSFWRLYGGLTFVLGQR